MTYVKRFIEPLLLDALEHFPAIYLNGPRQVGKSTLTQHIAKKIGAHYLTFDDANVLASARHDPDYFLSSFAQPVILDEAQLLPELFRTIKKHIDAQRMSKKSQSFGRYILTGSTNVMTLPTISNALVGRIQILTLLPLSAGEALQKKDNVFLSQVFSKEPFSFHADHHMISLESLIEKATYPELMTEKHIPHPAWFSSYISTLLQRDIQQLAHIENLSALSHLLKLLATRVGSLLNDAEFARDVGLNNMTYRRYRTLLENIFLIKFIPPWSKNLGKRLVKAPKVYFTDTELLRYLLPQQSLSSLKIDQPRLYGGVIENFVVTELLKKICLAPEIQLYHFRTHDQKEVNFILENDRGEVVAIEVKASSSVSASDFKHIEFLKEHLGKTLIKGIVLYTGNRVLPFGEKLYALPLSNLWNE